MTPGEMMARIRRITPGEDLDLYRGRIHMNVRKYANPDIYRMETAGIVVAFDDMEPAAANDSIMLLHNGQPAAVIRDASLWDEWTPPRMTEALSVRACACGEGPVRIEGPAGWSFECPACMRRSAPSHSLADACDAWNRGVGQ